MVVKHGREEEAAAAGKDCRVLVAALKSDFSLFSLLCSLRLSRTTCFLTTHRCWLLLLLNSAAEALNYLVARVQEDYNVEAGAQQLQRRAVSILVKPLGAPGEAAKNKAAEQEGSS
jgi:hypothetical protein